MTGTINKLSNSWTEFVNSVINSEELKSCAKLLNGLVEGATKLVNTLTPLGTIGLGAGLFKSLQNTKNSGGLIRLLLFINNSPFLATVEFSSDVYDSYIYV